MKRELKQKLKPIIKECVQEMLLEQGLLSKVIVEVIKGTQLLTDKSHSKGHSADAKVKEEQNIQEQKRLREEKWKLDREKRRKLLDATGLASDIFEGTKPLSTKGALDESTTAAAALSGVDPSDAGVNIDGIMAIAGRDWRKMI